MEQINVPIKVLLADDHPFIRAGIRTTLAAEDDLVLVGETAEGQQTQSLCCALMPDVLLLDLDMPGPRPTETVNYLHEHCPNLKVIVLTAYDDEAYIRGMLAAGAAGYVLKDEAPESVVHAIRTVVQGGSWFSRPVLNIVAQGNQTRIRQTINSDTSTLTARDQQLLSMIARGWDNQHIATELNLAEQTVRNYISRLLYQKMGFTSRGEAIIWAREQGLS